MLASGMQALVLEAVRSGDQKQVEQTQAPHPATCNGHGWITSQKTVRVLNFAACASSSVIITRACSFVAHVKSTLPMLTTFCMFRMISWLLKTVFRQCARMYGPEALRVAADPRLDCFVGRTIRVGAACSTLVEKA